MSAAAGDHRGAVAGGHGLVRKPYTEDDLYEDEQIIREAEEALPGALALLKSVERRVSELRYTISYSRARIRQNTELAASAPAPSPETEGGPK